jgi:hypothetical protein
MRDLPRVILRTSSVTRIAEKIWNRLYYLYTFVVFEVITESGANAAELWEHLLTFPDLFRVLADKPQMGEIFIVFNEPQISR